MLLFFEQTRDRLAETIRRVRPAHLALGILAGAFLLATLAHEVFFPILLLGLVIGLILLWAGEFLNLMRAPDDAFPGRFDKVIWALALLMLPPIGAPLFWVFRKLEWVEPKPRPGRWSHDGF